MMIVAEGIKYFRQFARAEIELDPRIGLEIFRSPEAGGRERRKSLIGKGLRYILYVK